MVVFQGFVTQAMTSAVGEHWSIVVGSLLRGAAFLLCAAVVRDWVLWVGSVMIVAAGALIDPCTASLVSKGTKEGSSGAALGAYSSMASLGSFLGPLSAGALYGASPTLPFWICAGISAVCAPAILRARISAARSPRTARLSWKDNGDALLGSHAHEAAQPMVRRESSAMKVSKTEEDLIRTHTATFSLPLALLTMAAREAWDVDDMHMHAVATAGDGLGEVLARRLSLSRIDQDHHGQVTM